MEMYLMFDEICITLVCLNKFLLCRASAMSCLLIGGLLLSMNIADICGTGQSSPNHHSPGFVEVIIVEVFVI